MPKVKFPFHILLWVALGVILGVFFCRFEFFKLDDKISLSDLGIFVMTSIVALYVASNIQKALSRHQTIKTLYQDDIKLIITRLTILDGKIESGSVDFAWIVQEMSSTNIALRSIMNMYSVIKEIPTDKLTSIINTYNQLKIEITSLSPIGTSIILSPTDTRNYGDKIDKIKSLLLHSIFEM
jgi:hypothetical protein